MSSVNSCSVSQRAWTRRGAGRWRTREYRRAFSCAAATLLTWTVTACGGDVPTNPFRAESTAAKSSSAAPVVAASPPAPSARSVAAAPPAEPPAPQPPPKPEWQLLLDDGIDSYEGGAYGNAIRKLEEAADNPQADKASRVRALKYLAFSYCVSPEPAQNRKTPNHLTLCRQSFERALAIDPAFELAQVERGHPIWGKQFQAARAAQSRSSSSGNASSVNTNAPQPLSAPAKTGPTSAGGSADPRKP